MLFRRKKIDNEVNPVENTEQEVKKYPIEDLYVAFICDASYIKYALPNAIPPYYEVLCRDTYESGHEFFYSIKSGEIISKRPGDCWYGTSCMCGERVLVERISLEYYLKNNDKKELTKDDISYIQRQLDSIKMPEITKYNRNLYINMLLKSTKPDSLKLPEEPKEDNISNGFLLELKKVMDKIDPNMNEELKEEYQTKLSNIGNEYINSIIENYSSIKLNPSLELEILKEYLKKLGALEEEIVKLNYRSNLESELEQIKKYEMKKDNN